MNKLIVMLGCAVIGAASIAGLTQARQSEPAARQERPSGAVNVRPHQAFSFDLGSKKAVGYFTSERAACGLTSRVCWSPGITVPVPVSTVSRRSMVCATTSISRMTLPASGFLTSQVKALDCTT